MRPRIGIVGVGGIGGYLGGMLTRTEAEVTVVARGARGKAIRERGIVLHSDQSGDSVTRPAKVVEDAAELEEQDFLLICVKNYSLEEVLPRLSKAVGPKTIVLPVMNGIDPGDRVRAALSSGIVVKCLMYIVSFAREDYSIQEQGGYVRLVFGMAEQEDREALQKVEDLLTGADIPHKWAEDIELEIWKKFMLNCCYNVATAYYDANIGPIRDNPEWAKSYEDLAREAYALARARGIPLREENLEKVLKNFREVYADDDSSSLQRDLHEGKPVEVETFSGYVVREGKRLGVPVPVSERMYEGLKKRMA